MWGCRAPDPAAMDQIQRHGRTAQPPSCAPLPDLGRCRGRRRSSTPTLGFGPWSCPPAPPTAPPTPSSPSSSTMPWPQGQHPPTSCSPSPAAATTARGALSPPPASTPSTSRCSPRPRRSSDRRRRLRGRHLARAGRSRLRRPTRLAPGGSSSTCPVC